MIPAIRYAMAAITVKAALYRILMALTASGSIPTAVPTLSASAVKAQFFSPAIPAAATAPTIRAGSIDRCEARPITIGKMMAYMDQEDPSATVKNMDSTNVMAGRKTLTERNVVITPAR